MTLLRQLWPARPTANEPMLESQPTPRHRTRPSRSFRRSSRIASRLGAGTLIALAITGGALFVTWDADYWQLRDRFEHISQALFGDYIPPACREDMSRCTRDPKTGRLVVKPPTPERVDRPFEACKGPEGLKLHCQLHALFDYFNTELFEGRLPRALITLQRKKDAGGYYWHQKFRKAEGGRIDEIAMNPSLFGRSTIAFLASILVHEMVHMEQAYFGKPGKNGFHNAEWGQMMKRVGLNPSNTGRPGGRQTGTRMSHYVIKGGAFERAAARHPILKQERLAFYE